MSNYPYSSTSITTLSPNVFNAVITSSNTSSISPYPPYDTYSPKGLIFRILQAENGYILEVNGSSYILNSAKKIGKQIEQILAVSLLKK